MSSIIPLELLPGAFDQRYTGVVIKKYRLVLSIAVLALTVALFVRYVQAHPETIDQLKNIDPVYGLLIGLLYLGVIISLSIVNSVTVKMCGKKIGKKESFSLTSSSSIANFFGPLQSGVGIRAVYFKTKLKIPIKQYGLMSLYYYAVYALLSGIFLLFGNPGLRLPIIAAGAAGAGIAAYYIRYRTRKASAKLQFVSGELLAKLCGAVLLQLVFITAIYFVELLAVGKSASLAQVISYSGAANFSLFVAITPGAIGIREAFLVFSERLHHIDSSTVIAANIVDRSVYVVFLALLLLWLILTHSRVQLRDRRQPTQA